MGIRIYRPTSPGRRNSSVNDYAELTTDRPEKTLCKRIEKHGGRNHSGKATVRFRGGGARRIYRVIDFKRNKDGVPATVASVEYDPNRTCFISLLQYRGRREALHPGPVGRDGRATCWRAGSPCEPKTGNCMPLGSIPAGLEVHNVEMTAGQGGKMVRGAGGVARIVAKEGDWVTLILPSGEMRMVRKECRATIGRLGNPDYQNIRDRQGGPDAAPGNAAARARQGPEPGRPSDGRRRGPVQRRTPSVLAERRAGQGRQDEKPAQDQQRADHSKTSQDDTRAVGALRRSRIEASMDRDPETLNERQTMGRSLKKGPFVDEKLLAKVSQAGRRGHARPDQDVGAAMHDRAGVRRVHVHGPQRQAVQQGLRHRRHGRAQAGRVFARRGRSGDTRARR